MLSWGRTEDAQQSPNARSVSVRSRCGRSVSDHCATAWNRHKAWQTCQHGVTHDRGGSTWTSGSAWRKRAYRGASGSTHAVWPSGSMHHRARTKLARAPRNLQRRKRRGASRARAGRRPCGRNPSNQMRACLSTASNALHSCRCAENRCNAARGTGSFNAARGSLFTCHYVARSAVTVLKDCRRIAQRGSTHTPA
ncbi:putative uncharacterized protein [Xanthomonas citri pv. mangiferaeindicae LMG 941]|nr:putative uncharacterized protein [Xanthomonas citri pv. mangiferaeindicae LMG 941]